MGQESVPDRHTTEVQTLDSGFGGVEGINHLQTAAAQVEVIAGSGREGERARGQTDEPTFFPAGEHEHGLLEDFCGRREKGLAVAGPPEGAGGHRHDFCRPEGNDFAPQGGAHSQGAANCGGLQLLRHGYAFPQADGVSLFMIDAENTLLLLGKEQFESVGAEVEHGAADGGEGHPEG